MLPTTKASLSRTLAGLAVAALLLLNTGCLYDHHYNMGATEKWVDSDINRVPKIIGTPFVSIGDSIISPVTAAIDQWGDEAPYNENHKYLSYAGSRAIARSSMGEGYQWLASVPSLIIETVWLLVTGPVDLVTVLASDKEAPDGTPEAH